MDSARMGMAGAHAHNTRFVMRRRSTHNTRANAANTPAASIEPLLFSAPRGMVDLLAACDAGTHPRTCTLTPCRDVTGRWRQLSTARGGRGGGPWQVQRLDPPDVIAAVHSDHRGQIAIFTLEDGNRPTNQPPTATVNWSRVERDVSLHSGDTHATGPFRSLILVYGTPAARHTQRVHALCVPWLQRGTATTHTEISHRVGRR